VQDINNTVAGEQLSAAQLVPQTRNIGPRDLGLEFRIPVFFFQGAQDTTTPTPLVQQYADSIQAPKKQLVSIDGGGHFAVFTKSQLFLQELLRSVRPLACSGA
jgi:pimeloyl-ACP methyl ester carboxylesterase